MLASWYLWALLACSNGPAWDASWTEMHEACHEQAEQSERLAME